MLRLAAVAGEDFDLALLESVDGTGDELDAVEAAVAAALVAETATPTSFRFVHALVRETLYRDLSAARRARLHRAIGQALAQTSGAPAADVARHLRAGAAAGGVDDAIDWSFTAIEEAFTQLARGGRRRPRRRRPGGPRPRRRATLGAAGSPVVSSSRSGARGSATCPAGRPTPSRPPTWPGRSDRRPCSSRPHSSTPATLRPPHRILSPASYSRKLSGSPGRTNRHSAPNCCATMRSTCAINEGSDHVGVQQLLQEALPLARSSGDDVALALGADDAVHRAAGHA